MVQVTRTGFANRCLRFSVVVVATLAAASNAWAEVQVQSCGATVPAGTVGFLSGDLDCSAYGSTAVVLEDGAVLELRGFSLIGNAATAGIDAVNCTNSCRVLGPGVVRDASQDAISAINGVLVEGVTLTGSGRYAVRGRNIDLIDATISENQTAASAEATLFASGASFLDNLGGVYSWESIRLESCTVVGNDGGVSADAVTVQNSTIDDNSVGIFADRVVVHGSFIRNNGYNGIDADSPSVVSVNDSEISGNDGDGIRALGSVGEKTVGRVTVVNSRITDNTGTGVETYLATVREASEVSRNGGRGIHATKVRLNHSVVSDNLAAGLDWFPLYPGSASYWGRVSASQSIITGNYQSGVYGFRRVKIRDSVATGNRQDPECGVSYSCADIVTDQRPRVIDTTCETSLSGSSLDSESWGVCSLDP